LRLDCVSRISNACTGGKACAYRLRRDERVGVRTLWFLFDPSSPARARILELRPLLSDNDEDIYKVERMFCLSDRSGFRPGVKLRSSSSRPKAFYRSNCLREPNPICPGRAFPVLFAG